MPFIWDQAYQNAFENVKQYPTRPRILTALVQARPLILYATALKWSFGAMLAQNNDEEKKNALYNISQTMVGAEINYSFMEKICLAIVFAIQNLRHYLLSHQIILISKVDPLKYILSKPMLSGRLAK